MKTTSIRRKTQKARIPPPAQLLFNRAADGRSLRQAADAALRSPPPPPSDASCGGGAAHAQLSHTRGDGAGDALSWGQHAPSGWWDLSPPWLAPLALTPRSCVRVGVALHASAGELSPDAVHVHWS